MSSQSLRSGRSQRTTPRIPSLNNYEERMELSMQYFINGNGEGGNENGKEKFGSRLEQPGKSRKISCHPNSAFEPRRKEQEGYPGVTKVSLPVWRIPHSKTQPLLTGFKAPDKNEQAGNKKEMGQENRKTSAKENGSHSRLFQPWKNVSGEKKTLPFSVEISKKRELNQQLPALEKLSSSSSESERKPEPKPGKNDSISDTEGMSGLKRLLRKETGQNLNVPVNKHFQNVGTGIKKSPSAGSTSYWSRISSGQPSFIRKFFEKSSPTPKADVTDVYHNGQTDGANTDNRTPSPAELPEPVLSLNVAQKANMFMKMEHDQRFSKWHNADKASGSESRPRSTRFFTQPVTTEEVTSASKAIDSDFRTSGEDSHQIAQTSTIQLSNLSASADVDDKLPLGSGPLEPSRLSLKDRVNMFNRMSSVPMTIVQSRPPSTAKPFGSNTKLNNWTGGDSGNTGGLISKSLNNDTDSSYDNLNGFMSDRQDFRRRRGSDSSVGISTNPNFLKGLQHQQRQSQGPPPTPFAPTKSPVSGLRNTRVKSMFITQSSDPDNLSEDGEISSGGQEVAEIISRSFENSPIFRKKSWRTQQPQPSFAKELWRKFGKPDEDMKERPVTTNSNQRGFSAQDPIKSPMFPKLIRSAAPATATSNLLPILTALSSSDDQLSEAKASNCPPVKPRRSNIRKMLNQKAETSANSNSSTMADKEDGQQCRFANPTQRNGETDIMTINAHLNESEDVAFSSVKREGDLLIMKKHMPILRRKSGGKSKNPLKVLAARMDFRNQKYTETLLDRDPPDSSATEPS